MPLPAVPKKILPAEVDFSFARNEVFILLTNIALFNKPAFKRFFSLVAVKRFLTRKDVLVKRWDKVGRIVIFFL